MQLSFKKYFLSLMYVNFTYFIKLNSFPQISTIYSIKHSPKSLNQISNDFQSYIISFIALRQRSTRLTPMGNSENKQATSLKDWQKVDTDNGIEIFKNLKTNQLAEKRIVTLDSQIDTKKQVQVYKMRQNNNEALVKAFGSDELTKMAESFVSCAGGNKIFVFTEKMPHRLSQLPQLSFPQSLLFLKQSLRAYQRLFKEYGPVEVTDQLIGLNYLGEVKSWLNSNWALNHRNHEYGNLRSKKVSQLTREQYLAYREQYLDQPEMIKSIISVIQKKCEEGIFPQAFKQEIISQSGSFKKLLLYLKDFVEYNQIFVPERISYDELVNTHYRARLDYQLNFFNAKRGQEQANRQGHLVNTQQIGLRPNGFANSFGVQQQPFGQVAINNQYQQKSTVQSHQPIGYVTGPPIQGYSQSSIPQPLKESPVSSDMGQVTFSQSTRNYSQQQRSPSQTTSNYQWSAHKENLYTPSFQKVQQSPQVGTYSSTQGGNYSFGGAFTTNHETIAKPGYTVGNNDFYQKYSSNNSRTTLEQGKPNISNEYGLSNGNYNYSSSFSSNVPVSSYTIGGFQTKPIQNPQSLGYTGLEDNSNKWTFSSPSTTYTTETYNYTSSKPVQTSFAITTKDRAPAYSFDGRNQETSRFGTGYTGTGYSNTLTKYETESTIPSGGFGAQNNYRQAFNSLLTPSIRGQTFEQITSTQSQSPNGLTTYQTQTIVTTTHQKRDSSNISGSNVSGRNNPHTPNSLNHQEAFTNVVERVSNDVSQSMLKME